MKLVMARFCPDCEEIYEGSEYCPKCGSPATVLLCRWVASMRDRSAPYPVTQAGSASVEDWRNLGAMGA